MNRNEFKKYRKRLNKTQKQMAELLGTSLKAIHSYEQGWRTVPVHVERQVGDLCWFINGTICDGISQKDWKEKMKICRSCEVFSSIL
jgi:DNA-binding XRE family transcriptional regulator